MMKKMILLFLAALMLAPTSGQVLKPSAPVAAQRASGFLKPLALPQFQEMRMREPGTAVARAPHRAGSAEVYYKRPAGAFPGFLAMDLDWPDDFAYYPYTVLQVKPYKTSSFKSVLRNFDGYPYYHWEIPYYQDGTDIEVDGQQDIAVNYGTVWVEAPILHVSDDDLNNYSYQLTTNVYDYMNEPAMIYAWPKWDDPYNNVELLKSSTDFVNGRAGEINAPLTCYSGMTPYGNNSYGWWFGKNGGLAGKHVDGIAQAFEKPEQPYLLRQVVLMAYGLKVTAATEMKCKIYRLDGVPDYQDTASVILPEEPGELIAVGSAQLPVRDKSSGVVRFTLYTPQDGDWDWLVDNPITIQDAIMIVIDGYNDEEMSALADFSALVGTMTYIDDGFGERAYVKVGKDDAEGNFDGHYQWQGINNFFSSGQMMTGLSIFVLTDQPFLVSTFTSDDYEYTFPAAGGVMEKTFVDDGDSVTVRSIEIASWTPVSDDSWSITCDGGEVPSWLNIELTDVSDYTVNAVVTAEPLPQGTDYREAVVHFAIPGDYMDYKFMQIRQGGEEPDTTLQEKTSMPFIEVEETDEYVSIGATGNGTVNLYFDGIYSQFNPVRYVRTNVERTVVVTATAQEEGKLMSDTACRIVTIAALPPDSEGYWFYVSDVEVEAGDTVLIPVNMFNEGDVVAFQTDIKLPEGFELVQENGQYAISLSERAGNDHACMANELSDGKIRLVCYSPSNTPFADNEGELFYIPVKVPQDASGDNYVLELWNTRYTLSDLTEYVNDVVSGGVIHVKTFIPGDVNDNGEVTVTDVVVAAQYILEMDPDPFVFEAADMNGDGIITVTDMAMIVQIILNPETEMPLRAPTLDQPLNERMSGQAFAIADGETRQVSIQLDNVLDYTGMQLDLRLPTGLRASNFKMTDRMGDYTLAVNNLSDSETRVLCYSPTLAVIGAGSGAVLSFDVMATGDVEGMIAVNGIELVTPLCQTVCPDGFAFAVNNPSAVKELNNGKNVRVYASGRDIIVVSPDERDVAVTDVAGHMRRVHVGEGRTVITGNAQGVHIVIAAGKATKLILN